MDARFVRVTVSESVAMVTDVEAVRSAMAHAQADATHVLDIGEAWAGLHFLITGETPIPKHVALDLTGRWDDDSLENVIMGGEPTPFEGANGPARVLTAPEVSALAKKLARIGQRRVMDGYDAAELEREKIPPGNWDDDATRTWLGDMLEKLAVFFGVASRAGDALLIVID